MNLNPSLGYFTITPHILLLVYCGAVLQMQVSHAGVMCQIQFPFDKSYMIAKLCDTTQILIPPFNIDVYIKTCCVSSRHWIDSFGQELE